MFHITDIISFTISEFSDYFIQFMNQKAVAFKSQFILEKLSFIDKGISYNIIHNSENKVTGIILMTSYMRDDFERYWNSVSIDVMKLYVCNVK